FAHRDVQLVGGGDGARGPGCTGRRALGGIDVLPPPLVTRDADVDAVCGRGGLGEVEDQLDGGDRDPGEDHGRDDGPDRLGPRVAMDLDRVVPAGTLPVLDQEVDDRPLDQDEDHDDDDEDLPEQVVGPAGEIGRAHV